MNAPIMSWLVTTALLGLNHEVPTGTEIIKLEPKFGTVTFRHKAHSSLAGVECRRCHHTHAGGYEPIHACHDCHAGRHFRQADIRPATEVQPDETAGQPSKAQEAFQKLCIGCHEEKKDTGKEAGPTDSCRDCHV